MDTTLRIDKPVSKVSLANLFVGDSVDDIESLDEFIRYVLYECSNCVEDVKIDEIGGSKLYKNYKNKGVCKEIRMDDLSDDFKKKFRGEDQKYTKTLLAQKTIDLFMKRGLLKKRGNVYYLLNTNRRLSWNNIKQLKMHHLNDLNKETKSEIVEIFGKEYDLLTLVKVLFWYFRKAIVDSILYDVITRAKSLYNTDDIVALSVGSTKLTSDYDISVDSLYEICGYIIKKFIKVIENIFNDDSEGLFDTNVYGVSFTKSKRDKEVFKMEHKCNRDEKGTVNYISIEGSLDMDVSQMIWSYIKLLLKMSFILKQDDKLYEKMYSYLEDKLEKNIFFDKALGFVNMYKSNVDNYKNIVDKYDEYMSRNSKIGKGDYLTSNFISFVNYNGSETYLTSGAFLDVVINQQLCLNKDQINLSKPYMYFISFIENMSDLLTHYHKTKYTMRSEKALINMEKLLQNDPDSKSSVVISEIKDILKWIGITQKKCVDDIYKCQVFDLMYTIIYSIVKVSDMFYEYIIKKFGKDVIAKSADLFSKLEFPEVMKQDVLSIIESESPKK